METRQVKTDKYGNALLSIEEGKKALLHGMDIDFAIFDDVQEVDHFNRNSEQIMGYETKIRNPLSGDMDLQVYHEICAADWNIPGRIRICNVRRTTAYSTITISNLHC